MRRGRFIVLEGVDGSGTTSQCALLADALRAQGTAVLTTAEPSQSFLGRAVRDQLRQRTVTPETLALMFAADRLEHVRLEIEPSLRRGEWVLCDRYVLSSWVYQGLECDRTWVRAINVLAPWPDLTLLLDIDTAVATARRKQRDGDAREIFETDALQERVATGYRAALHDGLPGLVRIDGAAPLESVTDRLLELCLRLADAEGFRE